MHGGRGTPQLEFFDRPFAPHAVDALAGDVTAWLRSDHLRWLVEHVPGRRVAGGPLEQLEWPSELGDPPTGAGRDGLAEVVALLGGICDWSHHGTVWDYRVAGERPFGAGDPRQTPAVSASAVAERAAALGLRSHGRLQSRPRTLVVLGGRRVAPLNRARAAERAIRMESLAAPRVVLLTTHRELDRDERRCPEVRAYAGDAPTEAELMRAAGDLAFGGDGPVEDVRLVEVPAPRGAGRASTYETLRFVADELDGPVGLVSSPTCRPFQYLDAARALGLEGGLSFELIAHPRAWAAAPGERAAAPHVYLQEVRSTIQAAGRLAAALTGDARPAAEPAALA